MAAWINPDRGEIFFARRVVFVEGQTEKALLPFLAKQLGCFDSDVSFIDCGGKSNLPLYVSLAKAFNLEYLVVHDEDPVSPTLVGDKKDAAERTFALNEALRAVVEPPLGTIEILRPEFETVAEIPKAQTEKKGKPLAALDHYSEKPSINIPDRLKEVVKTAFATAGHAQADNR